MTVEDRQCEQYNLCKNVNLTNVREACIQLANHDLCVKYNNV